MKTALQEDDWIGPLPPSWSTKRARFCFRDVDTRTETGTEELLSLSKTQGLIPRSEVTEKEARADSLVGYKICEPGDIVMNKMQAWNGMFGLADQVGLVSPDYTVFRPLPTAEAKYHVYLFQTPLYVSQFKWRSRGMGTAFLRLNTEDFYDVPLHHPPRPLQAQIAAFLDHHTARIDALIARKRRLIELLGEKRQALVSSAVRKGLNRAVTMKESGVQWLGSVPTHWDVLPVKMLFRSLDGQRIPLSAEERGSMARNFPYYGASGIIDMVENYLFDEPLVLFGEDGANLVLRSTPLAFVARGKYWVNNHAHVLRPLDGRVDFWACALNAIDVAPLVSGSAQPKLIAEALGDLRVAVPPASERDAIQGFLAMVDSRFTAVKQRLESSIMLFEEKRSALITAAVTGQLDLNSWQPPAAEQGAPK